MQVRVFSFPFFPALTRSYIECPSFLHLSQNICNLPLKKMRILPQLLFLFVGPAASFEYSIVGAGSLVLTDVSTSITDVVTLFTNEELLVTADGIEWEQTGAINGSDNLLFFETLVNGKVQATGNVSLANVGRELPGSIDAGTIKVEKGGRYTIEVVLTLDESEASTSNSFEAYAAGVAIIPLLVVLLFAVTTHMVSRQTDLGFFPFYLGTIAHME
jgi:hypothetical protein